MSCIPQPYCNDCDSDEHIISIGRASAAEQEARGVAEDAYKCSECGAAGSYEHCMRTGDYDVAGDLFSGGDEQAQ